MSIASIVHAAQGALEANKLVRLKIDGAGSFIEPKEIQQLDGDTIELISRDGSRVLIPYHALRAMFVVD